MSAKKKKLYPIIKGGEIGITKALIWIYWRFPNYKMLLDYDALLGKAMVWPIHEDIDVSKVISIIKYSKDYYLIELDEPSHIIYVTDKRSLYQVYFILAKQRKEGNDDNIKE